MEELVNEYMSLMSSLEFDEKELDYTVVERHKAMLEHMSRVSNCCITVFDNYRMEHLFTSYNFSDIFGYDVKAANEIGTDYFNERIHPEDMAQLTKNAILFLRGFFNDKEGLKQGKLINEYRIRDAAGKYVRVIEQHQPLEYDKKGNIWLSLSVVDLSPDQRPLESVKSKYLNCRTGEHFSIQELAVKYVYNNGNDIPVSLSRRELEVLKLVKDGLLSKEISEQLFISVHTVNTHRQKILEKLAVDNSMEAVNYAMNLGLLN